MTKELEKVLDKHLVDSLNMMGIPTIKLSMQMKYGTSGWPDRLIMVPKYMTQDGQVHHYYRELKRDGEEPTEKQQGKLDILEHIGANQGYLAGRAQIDEFLAWLKAAYHTKGVDIEHRA